MFSAVSSSLVREFSFLSLWLGSKLTCVSQDGTRCSLVPKSNEEIKLLEDVVELKGPGNTFSQSA